MTTTGVPATGFDVLTTMQQAGHTPIPVRLAPAPGLPGGAVRLEHTCSCGHAWTADHVDEVVLAATGVERAGEGLRIRQEAAAARREYEAVVETAARRHEAKMDELEARRRAWQQHMHGRLS